MFTVPGAGRGAAGSGDDRTRAEARRHAAVGRRRTEQQLAQVRGAARFPPDLYPGELSKEAVARGELTADRHESDPETANPSQICLQTKDGRWIMHSHIQQDLFDAWIDAIGFSWIREDERYKTAPAIPEQRGPHRAQQADLRGIPRKDRRRMARNLPPEPGLRRRDHADDAGGDGARAIRRQWPRHRGRRSARRPDEAARPLRQDERNARRGFPGPRRCRGSIPPRCWRSCRWHRPRWSPPAAIPQAARRHRRARMRELARRAVRRGACSPISARR